MRDPFSWSFPLFRVLGITVKIHILFPLVILGLIMRPVFAKEAVAGIWVDASMVMGLLFLTVLLHEFGHCFAGRWVGGEANEVLLWPLGGLAAVDVPHSARANFIMVAGGPLVNLLICLVVGLAMIFALDTPYRPPLNPFWFPYYINVPGHVPDLTTLAGTTTPLVSHLPTVILARLFWVSWNLFLFNLILVGYPMDGGRMFQCILWPYVGYRQATLYAVFAGFTTMFLLLFVSFIWNEVLLLVLAFFIYTSCKQQWILLETGGEDSLFGYDFSQGYTSLEKDQPLPPRRKQPNFFQRWLQRRAAKKLQRQQQQQIEEESRMDQLLEKIQRYGKGSLTEEEHRFLKRVADRYRNRP
jgi:stage IV sporulation protein FB